MPKSLKKFIKYFLSACVGLSVDLSVFWVLSFIFSAAASHVISYSTGLIVAFFIQKHFVFESKRKTHHAFVITLILWLIGLGLSTALIDYLVTIPLLARYPIIAKGITVGFTFWYNFFSRKFAFKD